MAKYIDAEKLIAEIERRISIKENLAQRPEMSDMKESLYDIIGAYQSLKSFITSLQHEQLDYKEAVQLVFEEELIPFKDGNQWCFLLGRNLQDGICGFGDTILDAAVDFYKDYTNTRIHIGELKISMTQQEQPMPDSTQLIEWWHEDKEMLKEKDFRNDPWRLAYNAFMCGFGRGIAVKKQEQPTPSCKSCGFYENNCPFIRGKFTPYPNKVCKDYTYSVMKEQPEVEFEDKFAKFLERKDAELGANSWSEEDLRELAEYFYFNNKQPEVDLEKAYKSYMESRKDDLSGNAVTVNMKDLARHFYELGLNARKEE